MPAAIDYTGQRFGKLVALEVMPKRVSGRRMWRFQCDCGNDQYITDINSITQRHKQGAAISCGCRQFERPQHKDYTGLRVGMLVAIKRTRTASYGGSFWEWRCDCGKTVERTQNSVKRRPEDAHCGCQKEPQHIDRTGQRIGLLVALRFRPDLAV